MSYTLAGIGCKLEVAPQYQSIIALTEDLKLLVAPCCKNQGVGIQGLLQSGCGMFYTVLHNGEKASPQWLQELYDMELEEIALKSLSSSI